MLESDSDQDTDNLGSLFQPDTEVADKRAKEIKAVVTAIFDPADMNQKGVLDSRQAFHLTRASIYADTYNSETMRKLVSYLLQFSVSNKGRGRSDLKTLLQAIMHTDEDQDESIRKRLLGS